MPKDRKAAPPKDGAARQAARRKFQDGMERRGLAARRDGRPLQKALVALAVCTLALGVAMLGLATRLDVNGTEDVPPRLALSSDPAEGHLRVLHAEPGLRWADLALDGDCEPLLNGRPLDETPMARVLAGDVLACGPGETLQIQSAPDRGDAILHRSAFPADERAPATAVPQGGRIPT